MRLRYLSYEQDRHGNERVYVRYRGRRTRIHSEPGSPAFLREVARVLEAVGKPQSPKAQPIRSGEKGTLAWLAALYTASPEFLKLDPTSQRTRRAILERCLKEQHNGYPMRNVLLPMMTSAKVKAIRDAAADTPGAANKRVQNLSAMFAWGIENGKTESNPCRDVKKFKYDSGGFHTWAPNEVAQFEKHYAIGTKPRLALALLLYLGVRRSDVVRLRPDMVRENVLYLTPAKTLHLRADESAKPILPELAAIIAASPTGKTFYLETSQGKPFTAAGFGNWFREQCDDAGLSECSAHGLRKAGATLAAERGATASQLMALYDWRTLAVAERYIKTADRKRLAADAAGLLVRR